MSHEQASDPDGWVDRHGDGLYRYALVRLGDADRAADLVQETFLHALRAVGSFSGESSERTWLIGILKHKLIDQLRASARRAAVLDAVAEPEFDQTGHWRKVPALWAGDPRRQVETQEFWEAFGSCLAKLPSTLSEAFLLRELDGLHATEVQDRLAITPANLWARLHRARSLLRQCLETNWFGDQAETSQPPPTANRRKAHSQ